MKTKADQIMRDLKGTFLTYLIPLSWVLFISAVFVLVFLMFTDLYVQSDVLYLWPGGITQHAAMEPSIELFNYAFSIIFAFIIVIITWVQLHGLNKVGRSDFIMRVIEIYHSPLVINAQHLIHEYSIELGGNRKLIAEKIKQLKNNSTEINNYICLKNYLDFLEGVAYLYNRRDISKEVNDFLIYMLVTHYECFEELINDYQKENKAFYNELAKVYESQKKQNNLANKQM